MPDIGATIAFVKASTGREPDLVVGKPNSLLVKQAERRMGVPASSMCMIGDRLYTDIALGTNSSILTILVLSGETKSDDVATSPYQPDYIFQDIREVAEYLNHMSSK